MDSSTINVLLGLRSRITLSTVTQEQVAAALGMNPAQFSRVLRGIRPVPRTMPHFFAQVEEAVQRTEDAEQAAEVARQRILTSSDLTLFSLTQAKEIVNIPGEQI